MTVVQSVHHAALDFAKIFPRSVSPSEECRNVLETSRLCCGWPLELRVEVMPLEHEFKDLCRTVYEFIAGRGAAFSKLIGEIEEYLELDITSRDDVAALRTVRDKLARTFPFELSKMKHFDNLLESYPLSLEPGTGCNFGDHWVKLSVALYAAARTDTDWLALMRGAALVHVCGRLHELQERGLPPTDLVALRNDIRSHVSEYRQMCFREGILR